MTKLIAQVRTDTKMVINLILKGIPVQRITQTSFTLVEKLAYKH